jgi:hypothetical protein
LTARWLGYLARVERERNDVVLLVDGLSDRVYVSVASVRRLLAGPVPGTLADLRRRLESTIAHAVAEGSGPVHVNAWERDALQDVISVVAQKDLPTTNAQINACSNGANKVCNAIIGGLIRNPKAPPGPTNDVAHWIVDNGQTGLDGPGDSVALARPIRDSKEAFSA